MYQNVKIQSLTIYRLYLTNTNPEEKTTDKYPNLLADISSIIEKYINVDLHFKTDILYVSVSPNVIIEELVTNYNYPKNFACYNTIKAFLKNQDIN